MLARPMTDAPSNAAPPGELPAHFDPRHASSWAYDADPARLRAEALAWGKRRSIGPPGRGELGVTLLLVDLQRDFCLAEGALFVAGRSGDAAIADTVRTCEFLYRNAASISRVVCTLDTHLPQQIFFPSFWRGSDGGEVEAGRVVTAEQVESGEMAPREELAAWLCDGDFDWLRRQCLDYCRRLEEQSRQQLFLWPEHCLLGSSGHALVGVVQEARLFHAYLRSVPAPLVPKGSDPLTEHYSVFAPEVRRNVDGDELGERNQALLDELLSQDLVVVAGQAASHCVRASVDDLLDEIERRAEGDEAVRERMSRAIVVLEDCTSAVVVPGADFTEAAEEALGRWRDAGVRIASSSQSVADWLAD
ncbi:MAG: nicotinamidase [Acidobacteria bacterium]|nr:MAG: nicotinamidase [Acidobacteriota bacterium]REK04296.1 MAG: nicotinamidase [Acidobacteriota bacterium]